MTGAPRVVLDTNVVVAASFSRGSASAEIIEAIRGGKVQLVWNEETRDETEHIVQKIPPISWERMADLFENEGRFDGRTEPEGFQFVPDRTDRKFAALAAAAGATLLTMDDHLLADRDQTEVEILTPREFVDRHLDR